MPVAALEVDADWSVVNNPRRKASWSDDSDDAGVKTSWRDGGDVANKSGKGAGPAVTSSPKAMGRGRCGLVRLKTTDAVGEEAAAALLAAAKAAREYILLKTQQ